MSNRATACPGRATAGGRNGAACVLLALLLAGCFGPAVKESYYTLAASHGPAAPAASGISVHVGPVIVPEAVDRLPMVIRTSPNQVDIDDAHRWAEPLKSAIPRVIADALMRELGTARVTSTRIGSGEPVDFRVAIEVRRFDSSLDQGATIEAVWTVRPAKGAARSGRSSLVEPAPSKDHHGIAAAHSRALERMAKEIAKEMRD